MNHSDLKVPGLCEEQLEILRALVAEPFEPRAAAMAYVAAGHPWTDIPRAYQALVLAGRLPDVGMIWRIARIAFREQPEGSGLQKWADTLGPDNWRDARGAADSYAADSYATATAAAYAAAYAVTAADVAAYAADVAAAHVDATAAPAADVSATAAAYAAAYAVTAADVAADVAAREGIRAEIIEMILSEVEKAGLK